MALIKWTPLYEPLLDIEQAFADTSLAGFNPAVDVYAKNNSLIAEIALAGIDPKNVKITVEDNVLNIEGSTVKKTEVDETNYYRKEVRSGSFHRLISLPSSVNAERSKAEYEKGMLRITMPKKDTVKATSVHIDIKDKK